MIGLFPLAETVGADMEVPVARGAPVRYVDLDCAATTPVLSSVWRKVSECALSYGSIHRGSGYKSLRSTQIFEDALLTIRSFVGGDERDSVLLSTNTTTALNQLARQIRLPPDSGILYSDQEHSSNMLPWWKHYPETVCGPSSSNGDPDLERWENILRKKRIGLVAVSAASNVTGRIVDVHAIARLAHQYGAKIVVDASQVAGHRRIDRLDADSPAHLDFVAFCGHKMYAPFGVGILVGPNGMLGDAWPDSPGGGTVRLIEGRSIIWADFPARERPGTQNFLGVVAIAEACNTLESIGFDAIADHEAALIRYVRSHISGIAGVKILRTLEDDAGRSLPIFPFVVEQFKPNAVGAYLGEEHGIGVRTGYLCQYDKVSSLLRLSAEEREAIFTSVEAGSMRLATGIVRASAGLTSTIDDLSRLAVALNELTTTGPKRRYSEENDGIVQATA